MQNISFDNKTYRYNVFVSWLEKSLIFQSQPIDAQSAIILEDDTDAKT